MLAWLCHARMASSMASVTPARAARRQPPARVNQLPPEAFESKRITPTLAQARLMMSGLCTCLRMIVSNTRSPFSVVKTALASRSPPMRKSAVWISPSWAGEAPNSERTESTAAALGDWATAVSVGGGWPHVDLWPALHAASWCSFEQ